MTQAELAEAADLHTQYVSQVERMDRSPALDKIDSIAAALGVTAAQLFAIGEGKLSALTTGSKRIEALLSAWPAKDRDRLASILIELRQLAGRPAKRRR